MKENSTHIAVILDRTGSMESIRDDVIGGFNAFVREQKEQPGKATLTLVQFDSQDPYEVIHRFTPIRDVPELTRQTFVPRASTPLLDALGRGINDLDQSLAGLDEADRPEKIIFVVITDGQENSSMEFRKEQIAHMIGERSEKDGRHFVFLSADLGAIADAVEYGIPEGATLHFEASAGEAEMAWDSFSDEVKDLRSLKKTKIGFRRDGAEDSPDPKQRRRSRNSR